MELTNFEKSQAAKIASAYGVQSNDDITKGRKAAEIGTKSPDGKSVKTATGWEPIKEEKQTKAEKQKASFTGFKFAEFKSGVPVIDEIMDKVKPFLKDVVERYKERAEKKGEEWNERTKEFTELALTSDLIGALGSYIRKGDTLGTKLGFSTYNDKGSIDISTSIVRDGITYPFRTDAVIAGGHTIQIAHYRYLVKTTLPSGYNKPLQVLEAKIKHMKEEDRIKKQISENQASTDKYQKEIDAMNAKTESEKGRFDDSRVESLKSWIKENNKKAPKLEQKLKDHLATEAKFENPEEGDIKITRAKKDYRNLYPIYLEIFKDGKFQHLMTTYASNVAKAGFNSTKDEDILKYRQFKKDEKAKEAANKKEGE
jgi:hypothetical protein